MKFTKLTALILSLALLLACVPFGGTVALASSDYDAKLEALKNAWTNLEVYTEVEPEGFNTGKGGTVTVQHAASTDTSLLPESALELPEKLGAEYTKATVGVTATATTPAASGSDYIKFSQNLTYTLGADVYLSFFVPELDGELEIVPFFRKNYDGVVGSGNNTGKAYKITQDDVGKWVTLSSSELISDSYKTNVENLGNHFILYINSTGNNTVYFGSLIINGKLGLPANSENWSLAQWISAAKALDTSKCSNVEAFELAIAEAENNIETKNILAIKNAWENLGGTRTFEAVYSRSGSATSNQVVATSQNLPKEVGTKNVTITASAVGGNTVAALGGTNNWALFGGSSLDVSKCNVYLSFYIEELKGEMSLVPYFRFTGSGGGNTGKEYVITEKDVGKWVTLNTDDLTSDTFKNVVVNTGNNIVIGINSTEVNTIKFGSFIFTAAGPEIPAESANWDLMDWIFAAKSVCEPSYYGVAELEEAIEAASQVDSVKEIVPIKEKWSSLQQKNIEILPDSGGAAVTGLAVSNSENLAKEVGSKYVTLTTAAAVGNTVAALSGNGNYVKYGNSSIDASKCGVAFSFYIEELKGEMSFVPYFRYNGTGGGNTGKEFVITEDHVGKWVTIYTEDLVSDTFSRDVVNLNNHIILGINSTEQNTVKFGSFILTNDVELPAESENWSVTEWKKNAKDLDVSAYYDTAEFTEYVNTIEFPYMDVVYAYEDVNTVRFEKQPHRLSATVDGVTTTSKVGELVEDGEFSNVNTSYLGYEYSTYTYGVGEKEVLIFENGQFVACENAKDMYLYYKLEEDNREDKTQDITVTPTIHWINNNNVVQGGAITLDAFTLSADNVGEWNMLTAEDIFGENGVKVLYNNGLNLYRVACEITNANGATITFGSMMFEGKMALPEDYDELTEADWLFKAYRTFQRITNTNTDALKAAIAPLEAKVSFGDANGDGKTNILDLVRMKKDISEGKYFVVEDLDKNSYVNGTDLIVIKKQMIGAIK